MMIQEPFSLWRWHRFCTQVSFAFLSIAALAPVFYGTLYYLSKGEREVVIPHFSEVERKNQGPTFSVETASVWVPSPRVLENLSFLAAKSRPDGLKDAVLVALAGERKKVSLGERVYISCLKEDVMTFSDHPTPFSLSLKLLSENQLEAVFQVEHRRSDGSILYRDQKTAVLESKKGGIVSPSHQLGASLKVLEKAKIYPSDKLIDLYGGQKLTSLKERQRLVFDHLGKSTLFIKKGDKFVFEEGRWKESTETEGKPLLWIKEIDKQKCEAILFDIEGLGFHTLSIPFEKIGVSAAQPLFSKMHFRSDASVTALLQNQNRVLRAGDWLLKVKGEWRSLQSAKEIKDCLIYAASGELFIFDRIEKKGSGHVFTGHLFDEKRTSVQKIELPLTEKKGLASPKKWVKPEKN